MTPLTQSQKDALRVRIALGGCAMTSAFTHDAPCDPLKAWAEQPSVPEAEYRGALEVEYRATTHGAPLFDGLNEEESMRLFKALSAREKGTAKDQRNAAIEKAREIHARQSVRTPE